MKYHIFGEKKEALHLEELLLRRKHIKDDVYPDIVFSLGGDGTILKAVQKFVAQENVKFVGINLGKLGFYTDYECKEADQMLYDIENGQYQLASYSLLDYVFKNDEIAYQGYSLNEIAIISPIHTQIIDVFIDQKHFETFRGTGFLVATPTGSTAYNKSLGGSVIDPNIQAMQLTEIASINNRVYKTLSSSLVFSKQTKLTLQSNFENDYITVDGIFNEFRKVKEIIVSLSDKTANFIVKNRTDFWDRVKKSFL
ncbi:MAG: NAD kinase [Bacilli bacterium]|jgi:NAD+ kinase|nr:NAD kinase [Bacilli bacterium]